MLKMVLHAAFVYKNNDSAHYKFIKFHKDFTKKKPIVDF